MSRMVIVKSAVNATVSIVNAQYGINRRWHQMGQPMAIPFETLEQCLWENGIRRMFDSGILYIESMQDKIDLGLEPAGATEPVNIIVLDEQQLKYLLTEAPIDEFKKKMVSIPRTQVDNLIEFAIHNELVDIQKVNFLKELTGKDILSALARKRAVQEAEKKEKESASSRNAEGRSK